MEAQLSQLEARPTPSLDTVPVEVLTMISCHLSPPNGHFIIYIEGGGSTRSLDTKHPPLHESRTAKVLTLKGTWMSLRLVNRQLYVKTKALISNVPILLRVEHGIRFSTARRLVGDSSLARVRDLLISFHERGSGKQINEEYYKYFLDVGPEDIRTSFPGLTKLTLVAPYEPGHIDSVYPEMVSIRNMIAATHPRIGRVKTISEYRSVSFDVSV